MFRNKPLMMGSCLTQPPLAPEAVTYEKTGVNLQPADTNDDAFRNTLAGDTEDDDGLSQMPHDVQGRFRSVRQLNKLEIMRKDRKTSLYPGYLMSKLKADIMQTNKSGKNIKKATSK